ncbi:MAG: DUF86 domain-containing protein [Campylobacterales bacterium]|nr:DUF86 domain-containing protein [Campylobacterales bacterium]HEO99080.1 DUF86 domain-containing protein [Campylobacterota bacterium]
MHNQELVKEILLQIDQALDTIKFRFKPVTSIDFLIETPEGQEKLDSLCMLFIAIGESLKNIDKLTDQTLLQQYEHIDWKAIKGMRDILSHHYFDINAEAIYYACQEEIVPLQKTIKQIIQEI